MELIFIKRSEREKLLLLTAMQEFTSLLFVCSLKYNPAAIFLQPPSDLISVQGRQFHRQVYTDIADVKYMTSLVIDM